MNASVTMRQAGQSKKMAEARLSFEERKTIHFLALSVYISISGALYILRYVIGLVCQISVLDHRPINPITLKNISPLACYGTFI
jgi:hypothetical protein